MITYESSAKTYEEALTKGLTHLGVSVTDVKVDILEEGSKGLFGLFGSRPYKLRLTVKEEEENLLDALKNPAPKAAKKPDAPKAAPVAPKAEAPKAAPTPVKKQEAPKAAAPAPVAAPVPEAPREPVVPAEQADPETSCGKAQQFLQNLTHLMGVDVAVHVKEDEEGNVLVNMQGDTLGILIGRRGETLDALQYLTSLKVNRGHEGYVRVTLDTENYRAKRAEALVRLANRMANRAVKTGHRVSLEPMNPYERRILHSALQENDKVETHSEGEEPNRHVVITLKGAVRTEGKPAMPRAPRKPREVKPVEETETVVETVDEAVVETEAVEAVQTAED